MSVEYIYIYIYILVYTYIYIYICIYIYKHANFVLKSVALLILINCGNNTNNPTEDRGKELENKHSDENDFLLQDLGPRCY
jgi:hypothetical protein